MATNDNDNENSGTRSRSASLSSQDDSGSARFYGSRRNMKSASFLAAQEEKIKNGEISEAEQTFKECVILVKKCLRTDMQLALEKLKQRDEIIQEIQEQERENPPQDSTNGNDENSDSENLPSKPSNSFLQDPRIIHLDAELEEDSEVHLYLANCYMALGNIHKQWRKYDEAQSYYEMSRDHYKLGFVNWGTDMKPRTPRTKSESNMRTRTLRMVDQILSDVNAPCVEQETEFFKRRTQMYMPGQVDTIELPGNRLSQGTSRLVKKFQRGSVQLGQGSFKETGERPQTIFSPMPPKLEEISSSSIDLTRRASPRPSATMNRMSVINEIMATERDYVADLEIVVKVWLNPIRVRDLLSESEIAAIFSNLETILQMNQTILLAFEKRLIIQKDKQEGTEMVGDIFQQMGDFFKMYKVYCADQLRALHKLEELTQTKSQFAQFLDEAKQDPRCRKLNLYGFLIKPVQRITKYPLLLRELVRNTPATHPDHQKLVDARNKIENIVNQINEATRSYENQQKILKIQNNVEGVNNLVAPARYLIQEGNVHFKTGRSDKPQECLMYLFNDLILLAKKKDINIKLISSKEYNLVCQVPLILDNSESTKDPYADSKPRVSLWADDEALKNAFQIRAQGKDYILSCNTPDECAKWYNAVKKAIRELHDKFIRRVSTGNVLNTPQTTPPHTPPTTPVRSFSTPTASSPSQEQSSTSSEAPSTSEVPSVTSAHSEEPTSETTQEEQQHVEESV